MGQGRKKSAFYAMEDGHVLVHGVHGCLLSRALIPSGRKCRSALLRNVEVGG